MTSGLPRGLPSPEELPDLLEKRKKPMAAHTRVLCFAGGIVFIALGFVGWLIPLVTGIPFYIVGFGLLGLSSGTARRWINKTEKRLPYKVRLCLRPKLYREMRKEQRAEKAKEKGSS